MKKTINIMSAVMAAFWVIVIVGSIIGVGTYESPTGDNIDYAFTVAGYTAFAVIAVIGLLNTLLFWRAGRRLFAAMQTRKILLKVITFVLSVLTTLSFCSFIVSIAMVRQNLSFVSGLSWLLGGFATVVLLVTQALQEEKEDGNETDIT